MTCDHCGRPFTGARWSIPAPGGVLTVCPRCYAIPVIEVAAPRVVLLTKDGGVLALPDESVEEVNK